MQLLTLLTIQPTEDRQHSKCPSSSIFIRKEGRSLKAGVIYISCQSTSFKQATQSHYPTVLHPYSLGKKVIRGGGYLNFLPINKLYTGNTKLSHLLSIFIRGGIIHISY